MRKILSGLLIAAIFFGMIQGIAADEMVTSEIVNELGLLSELTNEECVAFLSKEGIVFPYREDDVDYWGPIVREMIVAVENNPEHNFTYNFTVMQKLANDIKTVVNEYYGIRSIEQDNEMQPFATVAYGLKNSTLVGGWLDEYLFYNCYGYANGEQDYVDPGYYSNQAMSQMEDLDTIANLVKDDLVALGYTNVRVWNYATERDICAGVKTISLRIKEGVDYHFMRLDEDGEWYHKPGNTALLRYNYGDSLIVLWTNESYFRGTYYEADIKYDSVICYITFGGSVHNWVYQYNSNNTHIRTCTICDATSGEVQACVFVNNTCKLCQHYNFSGSIMSYDGVSACTAS